MNTTSKLDSHELAARLQNFVIIISATIFSKIVPNKAFQ
jgi:hypothetical protein